MLFFDRFEDEILDNTDSVIKEVAFLLNTFFRPPLYLDREEISQRIHWILKTYEPRIYDIEVQMKDIIYITAGV